MWTRAELKEKAKVAFKANYWSCVLVAFVLGLVLNGGSSASFTTNLSNTLSMNAQAIFGQNSYDDSYQDDYYSEHFYEDDYGKHYYDDNPYYDEYYYEDDVDFGELQFSNAVGFVVLSILAVIIVIVFVIAIVLRIFVFAPMEVGGCRFFIENSFEKASAGKMFFGFTNGHYKNVIYTMFLRDLYTFLWSLLFIIPGIVKAYEYRMVSYLLADCPDMPKEDAFAISKELMMGNKWNAFVLDLSFIGWNLLNLLTCGLLSVFWVLPYVHATNAELFLTLKGNYFAGQQTTFGEDTMKDASFEKAFGGDEI